MTFGDRPLPVPLFGREYLEGGPHGCRDENPLPPDARDNESGIKGDGVGERSRNGDGRRERNA